MAQRPPLTDDEARRVAEVFTEHQAFIEAVARRHAQSSDHVQDIVQSVGVRICQGLPGFRNESKPATWIYRLTVNMARTYYLQEWRQQRNAEAFQEHVKQLPEPAFDPDDHIANVEMAEALDEAVDQLIPQHQVAVRNELSGSVVLSHSRWTKLRARRRLKELLTNDPRVDL